MIIVDACSAILLAKASVIETATKEYNFAVTTPVNHEILAGKKKQYPDALLIERLFQEKKIIIVESPNELSKKIKRDFNMGEGESSMLAYGIANKSIVMTDNRQARNAAKVHTVILIGSIDIIVSLVKKKKITIEKAKKALTILSEEGWFHSSLIDKAKEDIQ